MGKYTTPEEWRRAPAMTVAYNAWISCVIPANQLLVFNVFKQNDKEIVRRMLQFLVKHDLVRCSRLPDEKTGTVFNCCSKALPFTYCKKIRTRICRAQEDGRG